MGQRWRLLTGLVVLAVVLAGCAGTGGGGDSGEPNALSAGGDGASGADGSGGGDAASGAEQPDASGDGGSSASGGEGDGGADGGSQSAGGNLKQLATNRAIIRTGSVTVRVDDFETQRERLNSEVNRLGGYVGGSTVQLHRRDNETWTTGTVTLRVPADSFSRMLSYAKDRGEVLSEKTSTRDVTDQLVELDARITNLERKRARIREFYNQASSTDALLRIENRLSEVQGKIERLKAKKRSLKDRVTYATLTVTMKEPAPDAADQPEAGQDRAGLLGTLRESVDSMLAFAYGGLLVVAAALPWLLALILLVGLVVVVRRLVAFPGLRSVLASTGRSPSTAGGAASTSGRGRQRGPSRPSRAESTERAESGPERSGKGGQDAAEPSTAEVGGGESVEPGESQNASPKAELGGDQASTGEPRDQEQSTGGQDAGGIADEDAGARESRSDDAGSDSRGDTDFEGNGDRTDAGGSVQTETGNDDRTEAGDG